MILHTDMWNEDLQTHVDAVTSLKGGLPDVVKHFRTCKNGVRSCYHEEWEKVLGIYGHGDHGNDETTVDWCIDSSAPRTGVGRYVVMQASFASPLFYINSVRSNTQPFSHETTDSYWQPANCLFKEAPPHGAFLREEDKVEEEYHGGKQSVVRDLRLLSLATYMINGPVVVVATRAIKKGDEILTVYNTGMGFMTTPMRASDLSEAR